MRPLLEATRRVTGKNFTRKYIALGRIVNGWDDIVGKALADKAQPVKLHYRKSKKQNTPPTATLEIAASHAESTLLHYQKDLILERINHIFGEKWITDIRFVTPTSQGKKQKRWTKKTHTPLTPAEEKALSDGLKEIDDEELKTKLSTLGGFILQEHKNES